MMKVKVRKKMLKKNKSYIRKWKQISEIPLNITRVSKNRRRMKIINNKKNNIIFTRLR
tara:strand:+ start:20 stop:193 length:174 start_codon:yes stop_codon:yes gene_type:complete